MLTYASPQVTCKVVFHSRLHKGCCGPRDTIINGSRAVWGMISAVCVTLYYLLLCRVRGSVLSLGTLLHCAVSTRCAAMKSYALVLA